MKHFDFLLKISPPQPGNELMVALLEDLPFTSFMEDEEGLHAYIAEQDFYPGLVEQINDRLPQGFSMEVDVREMPDINWNREWERHFEPIEVERLVRVRAPFHEPASAKFHYELIIEPQMSFGTGHHDTTWLMMQALFSANVEGKAVCDAGTGTGILAVLAHKLGALSVFGYDIDDWSVQNARHNFGLNGTVDIAVQKAGAECLKGRKFDIILANINRNVLVSDAKMFVQSLTPNGVLFLSGFFPADAALLNQEFSELGMKQSWIRERNGWAALKFERL